GQLLAVREGSSTMGLSDDDMNTSSGGGEGLADGGANQGGHDGGADGGAGGYGGSGGGESASPGGGYGGGGEGESLDGGYGGRWRRRELRKLVSTVPEAGPFAQQPDDDGLLRKERPALRRCVAVDLDDFATSYWGSRALLSHGPDLPAPYDDLFSLDAVDEL